VPQASRTFRIFVSSTFADLKAEREALQRAVFAKLRELCQQHGARFQAIDLRWGVSEEAAVDQQTMTICLEELRRCQKVTPRPNFIVLLGERYGWLPLPPRIPPDEFEEIERRVAAEERALLGEWYRRDDNAVPPEYLLQPRTGEHVDSAEWSEVEARLHGIMLDAVQQMDLPEGARIKYHRSATEQEILEGALKAGSDHAFCYFRTIAGLPTDGSAPEFHNRDGQDRLADVKDRLRQHFPPEHVHEYTTQWSGSGVTSDHLGALCERVEADLSRVILEEMGRIEQQDELEQEVASHEQFGRERARHFLGREDIIAVIRGYLRREDNHPLVVWGPAGSGKSALMARCVELTPGENRKATAVFRYIGATPGSTDIRSLLESLCRQLCRSYGADEREVPGEYRDLVQDFPRRLALVSAERPLVLFLDALDQLSPTDNAHTLHWLPRELPPNVRIVCSALEREGSGGECLRSARVRLPEASLVELKPITPEEGAQLLDIWLGEARRMLQPEQRDEIMRKFGHCPLPLFLKLAFEEARRWKSYDGAPRLGADTEGIIRDLFARLRAPANHGQVMVSKSLGYLAAARNGLTEDELLDVLSADQEAMEDFRHRSPRSPEVDRLPVVVWSRLFFDLEPYLTERAADRTSLLSFYHRQLAGVVTDTYLTDGREKPLHAGLASYFAKQPHWFERGDERTPNYRKMSELPYQQTHGKVWAGLEQTLADLDFIEAKCTGGMTYDLVADYDRVGAGRMQPGPPIRTAWLHEGRYGVWCPFCLAWREIWQEQLDRQIACMACESALKINPFTIEAEWHPSGPRRKVDRGDRVGAAVLSPAATEFGDFVRARSHVLVYRPHLVLQEGYNLGVSTPVSRSAGQVLHDPRRSRPPWVERLNRPLQTAGPCVQTVPVSPTGVSAVAVTPDGRYLITGDCEGSVRVWDHSTGQCLQTLGGHERAISAVAVTPDGRQAVSGSYDNTLRLWHLEMGTCLRLIEGHTDSVVAVDVTARGELALAGCANGVVKVWSLGTGACLRTLRGDTQWVSALAVTPGGREAVAGGADGKVRVWDLASGACLRVLRGHAAWVEAVAVTPDGRQAVTASLDRTARVWNLATGDCLATLEGHGGYVVGAAATPDGLRVVTGGDRFDGTARTWVLDGGKAWRPPERHTDRVGVLAVAPDGRRAVTGSDDTTVKVWDLVAGTYLKTLRGHREAIGALAVTPDSRGVVSGAGSFGKLAEAEVKVWDLASGACAKTFRGHTGQVWALAVTPDGSRALSGGGGDIAGDIALRIWNLGDGSCFATLQPHSGIITGLALTPDGRQVVAQTHGDAMGLWELATGMCLRTLVHKDLVLTIAVSSDGRHLFSGGSSAPYTAAGAAGDVRVWDLETGDCVRTLRAGREVLRLALTPDDRRVIWTAGDPLGDAEVHVCDSAGRWDFETLGPSTLGITGLAVTADARRLVTASLDRTVKVWDLTTSEEVACFIGEASIWGCAVNCDGTRIVAGDTNGNVYLLAVQNLVPGPAILTAWHSPVDGSYAFGCVLCREWSQVPESTLDTELPCPNCGKMVKLNQFVIEADWRPIAKAWNGEE